MVPGEKLTLFACERGSAWMSPGLIVRFVLVASSLFPALDFLGEISLLLGDRLIFPLEPL